MTVRTRVLGILAVVGCAFTLLYGVVSSQQPVGPGAGGSSGVTDQQYDTLDDLPSSCTPGTRVRVRYALRGPDAEQWCNDSGAWESIGGVAQQAEASTGIVLDASNLLAEHPGLTTLSQSGAIDRHHTLCVTSGTTVSLPALATAKGLVFYLMICDAGSSPFTLTSINSELMNGALTPQQMSGQWSVMEVRGYGTVGWSVKTTTDLSTILATVMSLSGDQSALGAKTFSGSLVGTGTVDFSAASSQRIPLQASPTQTTDGDCRWSSTTHKMTCGHNAAATVTQPQVLCRVTGVTSVNDSGSGSGSDFNHTGAACSIPANTLFAGDVLNVRIYGRLVTGATGTTILAGLKQSTTTDIIRTTGASTGNSVAGNYWFLDFLLVVSADPGASVSVTGYAGNILVGMRDTFNSSQTGPVNLATNGVLSLTPFTRWSAAGGSDNEIDVRGMIVTRN